MSLSSVVLPKLHLSSIEQDLDLVLQGSLQLRLSGDLGVPSTSCELLRLVTEEHLWIARTGSCYLNLHVSVQGEPLSERHQIAQLAEWVQGCELWDRLELRLQYRDDAPMQPPGDMSFSLQHPDLSSALVAPADAFAAEFRSVSCSIDFSTTGQGAPVSGRRSRKRRKCRSSQPVIETDELSNAPSDDDLYKCLAPEDRKAIDEFMLSLNTEPTHTRGRKQAQRNQPQPLRLVGSLCLSDPVRCLLEVALRILVLGTSRQYKGISVQESTPAQALARLAPAVFHVPYLKTISVRASLLPVIATSLARMRNAESPSLRQKVASFGAESSRRGENPGDTDSTIRGIERGTWDVLLATVKAPAQRNKSVVGRQSRDDFGRERCAISSDNQCFAAVTAGVEMRVESPSTVAFEETWARQPLTRIPQEEQTTPAYEPFSPSYFVSPSDNLSESYGGYVAFPGSSEYTHHSWSEEGLALGMNESDNQQQDGCDYSFPEGGPASSQVMPTEDASPLDPSCFSTFNKWLRPAKYMMGEDMGSSRTAMFKDDWESLRRQVL